MAATVPDSPSKTKDEEPKPKVEVDAIGLELAITPNASVAQPGGWKRFIGIGLIMISTLLFSLALVLVTIAHRGGGPDGYSVFTMLLWRFQGLLYPSLLWAIIEIFYCKDSHPFETIYPCSDPTKAKMFAVLLTRSGFGCAGSIFQYIAATYIGAAEAATISLSAPVLIALLGWILFNESYGVVPAIATVVNVIGLIILAEPPWLFGGQFDKNVALGLAFGLISMLGVTGVMLSLRALRHTSFCIIGVSFGIIGSIVALAGMAISDCITEFPRNLTDWGIATVIGGASFLGQVLLTISLRFEEAGIIAMFQCTAIVFAYMWKYVFLKSVPSLIKVGGTAVIITGVLLIGARKVVNGLPEDNVNRKRFRFLLW